MKLLHKNGKLKIFKFKKPKRNLLKIKFKVEKLIENFLKLKIKTF